MAMTTTTVESPLSLAFPDEIHLKNAPLVRVLAQLRFPVQPAFDHRETTAPIFEALRHSFPVVREETVQGVMFQAFPVGDPTKTVEPKGWTIWRLFDVGNAWRVSLSRDFLALETSAYQSHGEFISQWRAVLESLPPNLRPPVVDRFGLRYVDRLTGPALHRIAELVRGELLGVLGTADADRVLQTISDCVFDLTPDRLIARWGKLPPNASYDPGTINQIPEPSWILDLDMVREQTRPFDIGHLIEDAQAYANRIYTFFRWAVKPEFLAFFNEGSK